MIILAQYALQPFFMNEGLTFLGSICVVWFVEIVLAGDVCDQNFGLF
jgi:hypothetical protein